MHLETFELSRIWLILGHIWLVSQRDSNKQNARHYAIYATRYKKYAKQNHPNFKIHHPSPTFPKPLSPNRYHYPKNRWLHRCTQKVGELSKALDYIYQIEGTAMSTWVPVTEAKEFQCQYYRYPIDLSKFLTGKVTNEPMLGITRSRAQSYGVCDSIDESGARLWVPLALIATMNRCANSIRSHQSETH